MNQMKGEKIKKKREKKPICQIGYSCGYSCISKKLRCWANKIDPTISKKLKNISKEFNFTEKLGQGAYGEVWADRVNNVARKTILTEEEFKEDEIKMSKIMGDKGYSPKIHEVSPDNKTVIMDIVPGKPLDFYFGNDRNYKLSAKDSETFLEAMVFMQKELGYAHTDIHGGNVMTDGSNLKIIDYGLARPVLLKPEKSFKDLRILYLASDPKNLKKLKKYSKIVSILEEASFAKTKRVLQRSEDKYVEWLKDGKKY